MSGKGLYEAMQVTHRPLTKLDVPTKKHNETMLATVAQNCAQACDELKQKNDGVNISITQAYTGMTVTRARQLPCPKALLHPSTHTAAASSTARPLASC